MPGRIYLHPAVPAITSPYITGDAEDACSGSTVTYSIVSPVAGADPHYQWMVNGQASGANSPEFILDDPENLVQVSCLVTSSEPCAAPANMISSVVMVNVFSPVGVTISPEGPICAGAPTWISPGSGYAGYLWSDGINDRFMPVCSNPDHLTSYNMIIYNRWGQLIFRSKDIGEGWDGTQNGNHCQSGVYTYYITYMVSGEPGGAGQLAGTVTLIR